MFRAIRRIKKLRLKKRFNLLLLSSGFTKTDDGFIFASENIVASSLNLLGFVGLTFVVLKKTNLKVDVGVTTSFVGQFPSLIEEPAYETPTIVEEYREKYKRNIEIKPSQYESRFEEHQETFNKYFSENQVPIELENIVVIETRVRNDLTSSAGAKGPWQFMPATGKSYGLYTEEDIRDWEKSTSAAARYMKYLYKRLHSWDLVVMAYNCGPGKYEKGSSGVLGAMFRAGVSVKDSYTQDDIWRVWKELKHDETRKYYLAYLYLKEHNVYTKPVEESKVDEEPSYININEDFRVPYSFNSQPLNKDNIKQDV